jgi:hypothetical protein
MANENFSCSVLEGCSDVLAVSSLPRMVCSDLGSPVRVMDAVARMRISPGSAARLLPAHSRPDERVAAP